MTIGKEWWLKIILQKTQVCICVYILWSSGKNGVKILTFKCAFLVSLFCFHQKWPFVWEVKRISQRTLFFGPCICQAVDRSNLTVSKWLINIYISAYKIGPMSLAKFTQKGAKSMHKHIHQVKLTTKDC